MNYLEIREKLAILHTQKHNINSQIDELNRQLMVLPEYTFTFLDLNKSITKESSPYLYDLLSKLSMVDNDERGTLEWGRGKNIVDYDGVEFTYENTRYTTGYAHNWCTGEYFFTKYEDAERNYYEITNDDVQKLNDLWDGYDIKSFEDYIKTKEDVIEQISLLIFVTQNLMGW